MLCSIVRSPVSPRHVGLFHNTRLFLSISHCRASAVGHRAYNSSSIFKVSEEVVAGVAENKPVVALESTIYTHGFPYPDNVELASHLESVVRKYGGIPATIGVLNGVARVGLSLEELRELVSPAQKSTTMKVSRRDLPYITGLGLAGRGRHGGTTIAATMYLAHRAGIRIFGTGGLGGVHRGGEHTMDVSADLTELGRTPVAVISSGCKSFLDIPRTLEYLETQGVSVSTFADGRTGDIDLPAFWSRDSGVRSPTVVQDEIEAAAIIYARKKLDLGSGLFFANPIPLEYSLPKTDIDRAIEEAVQDAERQGIRGHANTPFILDRIKELTEGKSIPANRALITSNVARATKVAVEYCKLLSKENNSVLNIHNQYTPKIPKNFPQSKVDIVIAGSVAVDLSCDYSPLQPTGSVSPVPHTSNPAIIRQAVGGVGHNVAMAAHLIGKGTTIRLCSLVADDLAGSFIRSSLGKKGLNVSSIVEPEETNQILMPTAQYVAVNDGNKDLALAMADMRIMSSPQTDFRPWKGIIHTSGMKSIVVDTNWDEATMFKWIKEGKNAQASVVIEPVSVEKAQKLFPITKGAASDEKRGVYPDHDVDLITPNEHELNAMYVAAQEREYLEREDWWKVIDALGISSQGITPQLKSMTSSNLVEKGIPQRMMLLLPFMPTIITKLGAEGLAVAKLLPRNDPLLSSPASAPYILSRNTNNSPDVGGVYLRHYPAAESVSPADVVSVNGVGDTFLGIIVTGLAKGLRIDDEGLIGVAQKAAVLTLKSEEAVSPEIAGLAGELAALCLRGVERSGD